MPDRRKRVGTGAAALAALAIALAGARPGAAQQDHRALLAKTDQIAQQVARLRGLKVKRPIKRGVMNKAQITERLLERVRQEYAPGEIEAEEL
ncbi:MAG TPA: hypothetical protein VKZ63_17310, partial [Kofleriaceae bacterium]|nr:hypothetical protein [Kofleriaceae bacterium]